MPDKNDLRTIAEMIKSWTYSDVRSEAQRLRSIAGYEDSGLPPFEGTEEDFAELLNDWAGSILDTIDDPE